MDELDRVGAAFFRLYRMWSRRGMRDMGPLGDELGRRDLTMGLVAQLIVDAGEGEEITVGAVADGLNIDASNASRLVAETVRAGYVARSVSQLDGRRSTLTLTPAGRGLLDQVRRHQRTLFDTVTARWSEADRVLLAQLFARYVDDLAAARARDQ